MSDFAGLKLLSDAIQNMRRLTPEKKEIERLFYKGEYRASVVMSFLALENMLKKWCQIVTGKDHSKDNLNNVIETLKEEKAIDNETYHKLHYFRNLRNSIIHSTRNISREEAHSLIVLISKMLK
jgi:uncharacterized protein YutE (UPF0331/DUF86 family)